MAAPARRSPSDPLPAEAPTAPTADEWAAMTPVQRAQATDALLAFESVEEDDTMVITDREIVGKLEQMVDAAVARAGQEEARAEQATTQLASAILTILTVRGLVISAEASERIRGCSDLAILERWLGRVAAVSASEDLFLDA